MSSYLVVGLSETVHRGLKLFSRHRLSGRLSALGLNVFSRHGLSGRLSARRLKVFSRHGLSGRLSARGLKVFSSHGLSECLSARSLKVFSRHGLSGCLSAGSFPVSSPERREAKQRKERSFQLFVEWFQVPDSTPVHEWHLLSKNLHNNNNNSRNFYRSVSHRQG